MSRVGKPRCKVFVNEATHTQMLLQYQQHTKEHTLEYPAPKANRRGLELIPIRTSGLILVKITSMICFSAP